MPTLSEIPRRRLAMYVIVAATTIVVLSSLNREQALTALEYIEHGQAICVDMGQELNEQFARFDEDPDTRDDVARRAGEISTSALQQLIDLNPPDELVSDRDAIVSQREALQELQRQFNRGDIEIEELRAAGNRLEGDIDAIWPGCSQALNPSE